MQMLWSDLLSHCTSSAISVYWLEVAFEIDCSQSPIFPWDRRCRSLSPTGRHLGLLMWAKLTTRVIESGIHHFPTQAKIVSISEQNVMIVSVCFLPWRIGVKREQKEAVSRLQKDFPACGPNTKMYFQKVCWANFVNSSSFEFRPKYTCSLSAEILKLTRHHEHTHLVYHCNLRPLLIFSQSEKSSFVLHSFDST